VLAESDLIKFARRPVTKERAAELGRECRVLVRGIDEVVKAQQGAAARPAQEKAA
jgi:hypothetical protein